MTAAVRAWPLPRWIAHRGAGKLAPDNTLAAFRVGAAHEAARAAHLMELGVDGVLTDAVDRFAPAAG